MKKQLEEEKNREAIFAVLHKFCNSLQSKDLDTFQSLLHKEIIFIPHDNDFLHGREQVSNYYHQMLEKLRSFEMSFEDINTVVSPPYACVVGKWQAKGKIRHMIYDLKAHFRAEAENFIYAQGRFTAVFQKVESNWLMLHGHSSLFSAEAAKDNSHGNF